MYDVDELLRAAGIPATLKTMTREQAAELQHYMEKAYLIPFTMRMFPRYKPSRHHHLIAHTLEKVADKKLKYVIITMPPRHGKSELASVHFPPWFLGRHPDERIIAVSYASSLVNQFSRRARNVVLSDNYPFEGITLDSSAASVTSWNIAGHRGGYLAAGVGGGITGMGANVLLIDDPVKNQEEANSPVVREAVWEWFQSTALTRMEPGAAVVLIGTRWHEDDLIGRALQMPDIEWEKLYLPAEADPTDEYPDILNREPGEWLWPERFSPKDYEDTRKRVGERNWLTQYQGRPYNDAGNTFRREWWQRYPPVLMPTYVQKAVLAVDSAFKTGVNNDFSVLALWVQTYDYNYYLLDLIRGRWEFPELISQGYATVAKWRPRLNVPIGVLVEDAASGQSAMQVWSRTDQKQGRPPLYVWPFKNMGRSKEARADGVTPLIQARRVFIPEEASWVDEFIEEHIAFPYGLHDDMVDTTSMALTHLALTESSSIGAF